MPKHTVNVYQRPVEGDSFIGHYEVFNYRHKISAVGGFDTASFDIAIDPHDIDFWFDRLGCSIFVYVDNPVNPIWEGFINRVNVAAGVLTYTSSLDELCNRASVVYTVLPAVATFPQNTTAVNNTDSQAIYGIKEGALDGYLIEGTDFSKLTNLQAMVINNQSYPQKSTVLNPQGQDGGLLHVECLGWYQTLQWVKYMETSASPDDVSVILTDIVAAYPNTDFFNVTDASLITSNAAFAQSPRSRTNQTYWEMIQSLQEAGDGSSQWVAGITPYSEQLGYRRFYYRRVDTTTRQYAIRSTDARIRNLYGQLVDPWTVRPDGTAKVLDYAVAWNKLLGDNPTEFYVDTVDYDANAQSVQFGSTDNITAEGALNVRRYFKTTGRRFGAPQRRAWS